MLVLVIAVVVSLPLAWSSSRDSVTKSLFAAQASPDRAFHEWAKKHERPYIDDEVEYKRRRDIWLDNLDFVHQYNAKHESHWLGMNEHADLTQEEFAAKRLGLDGQAFRARPTSPGTFLYADIAEDKLPEAIDWRERGAVSPVKNQEQCGSCWAFSTTGAIEGVNAIYTAHLEVLSEQELVDCDTKRDNGCNGGLMDTAFQFVIDNGGIDTEADYKYHATRGVCSVNRRKRDVVTIDSYADVPSQKQRALKAAVAHHPVATAIQANQRDFQLYMGGVLTAPCGNQLDHGVLIVGYGRENHTDYWLIKNSWGQYWGDQGYIKILRSDEDGPGQCGVAEGPSYPIKWNDNPPRPPKPAPDPPPPAPSPTPGPSPQPVVCDSTTECFPDTTCCCLQEIMKACIQWACCPIPDATCCDDHIHCCPKERPVCNVEQRQCLTHSQAGGWLGLATGLLPEMESGPMYEKVAARRSFSRAATLNEMESK